MEIDQDQVLTNNMDIGEEQILINNLKRKRKTKKNRLSLAKRIKIYKRLEDIFFPNEIIFSIIDAVDNSKSFWSFAFTCQNCYQYCKQLYKKKEIMCRDKIFILTSRYENRLVGSAIYHIMRNETPYIYNINLNHAAAREDIMKSLENKFTIEKITDEHYKLTNNFVIIYCNFFITSRLIPITQMITDIDSVSIPAQYMSSMLFSPPDQKKIMNINQNSFIIDNNKYNSTLINELLCEELKSRIDCDFEIENINTKKIIKNIYNKKFSVPRDSIFLSIAYEFVAHCFLIERIHPSLWNITFDSVSFSHWNIKIKPNIINKLKHIENLVENGWTGNYIDKKSQIIKFPPHETKIICEICLQSENSIYFKTGDEIIQDQQQNQNCNCTIRTFCLKCFINFIDRISINNVNDLYCQKCQKTFLFPVKYKN